MNPVARFSPVLLLLWLCSGFTLLAQQRVEVSRDLWISAYPTESEGNNGASHRLKLKGIQESFLIDFDPTPFQGKRVKKAQLHLHSASPDQPLRRVTISTITQDWIEGDGTGYKNVPGASSFLWAKNGEQRWGNGDVDITAVVCGEGGSLWGFGDTSGPDEDGWQVVPIDLAVVQARLDGLSHGFYVIDDVGSEYLRDGNRFEYQSFRNRYVSSREDKASLRPFFTLWLEDTLVSSGPQTSTRSPSPSALQTISAAELPPIPDLPNDTPPLPCRDLYGDELLSTNFYAAKGEAIGFSVPAKLADVQVHAPGLQVKLYSMPRVTGFSDPLVPKDFSALPSEASESDETFIDLYVPKDTPAGLIEASVLLGDTSMPFLITVWNFTLPDRLSFLPQMNAYGFPNHVQAYYRLAHEHRCVMNQLPYSWVGRVDEPAPKISPDGTWDWTDFDAEFGPILDGSAFTDLPRGPVPVDAYYLLLNENWPMSHDEHFRGGYWIDEAYDEAYWVQFRHAAAEIARHIQEKGWTEPMFEFFLNNKVYFKKDDWRKCSAAWIFDEPVHTQDFWALRHYGLEFWKATAAYPDIHLSYRADISRPQWQRDLLDHNVNVEIISGALRTYWPRIQRRAKEMGNLYYMYGTASPLGTPAIDNVAWCVETWALGGDGVVPWNTIGKAKSWTEPDETSLFYPTPDGPVPSRRLKAYRAGQQLIEYLTQYCAISGQSRDSVMATLRAIPGLSAQTVKANEADAGKSKFTGDVKEAITSLRMRLGRYLDQTAPEAKDRWFDPRPPRPDFEKVPQYEALQVGD